MRCPLHYWFEFKRTMLIVGFLHRLDARFEHDVRHGWLVGRLAPTLTPLHVVFAPFCLPSLYCLVRVRVWVSVGSGPPAATTCCNPLDAEGDKPLSARYLRRSEAILNQPHRVATEPHPLLTQPQ